MIKIMDGDLFSTTAPIIAHQVNCQGKMRSGVALQIRELYPEAYTQYIQLCHNPLYHNTLLGTAQQCICNDKIIYNLYGQDNYGYDGGQYTNTYALKNAMKQLADYARRQKLVIAMPYKIGCCRGGADWDNHVFPMIQQVFENNDIELWKL